MDQHICIDFDISLLLSQTHYSSIRYLILENAFKTGHFWLTYLQTKILQINETRKNVQVFF